MGRSLFPVILIIIIGTATSSVVADSIGVQKNNLTINELSSCATLWINNKSQKHYLKTYISGGGPTHPPMEYVLDGDISRSVGDTLVAHGFENVSVGRAGNSLTIAYENRIYRSEVTAIGVVLALASSTDQISSHIVLIPKSRNLPLLALEVDRCDYNAFTEGILLPRTFASKLRISQGWSSLRPSLRNGLPHSSLNSTYWKADVVVRPGVVASFGIVGDWARLQFNIIPIVALSLPAHLNAITQVIVPLYDELGSLNRSGNDVRIGSTTLTHAARFPGNILTATSIGYFDLNKYGIAFEAVHLAFGGNLLFGGQVGRVGYLNYQNGIWYYSDIVTNVYLLTLRYNFPLVDFYIAGSYGKFLFGDVGWRIDFQRTFRELDLGFFGIQSDRKLLGGIRISLPLLPSRHRSFSRRLRVRSPVAFPWTYRYRPENGGFLLSNAIENFQKRLSPSYIRNNIVEIRRQAMRLQHVLPQPPEPSPPVPLPASQQEGRK